MKTPILSLLLALSSLSAAEAAEYFVSGGANSIVTGVDDNAAGRGTTAGNPFRTIQFALGKAGPGDFITVRQGTYTNGVGSPVVNVNKSGLPGQQITFRRYSADAQRPLIKFNSWHGFQINGNISYIGISGFRIQGNNANVTLADATNQPRSCATNGAGSPDGQYNGNGISVSGSTTAGAQNPHHLRFIDNEIFDCGGAGIVAQRADYVTIERNVIYNNSWYTVYATSGISLYQSWNYDTNAGYHNVISRNRCFGNRLYVKWWRGGTFGCAGITDGNGIIIDDSKNTQNGSQLGAYTGRTLVDNNLLVNNGGAGVQVYSSEHVDVINNTAYHNGQSTSTDPSENINNGEIYARNSNDVRIQNNILSAAPGEVINTHGGNTSSVTYGYNLFFGGTGSIAFEGDGAVKADPQFTAPDKTNPRTNGFRLKSTSPAIGRGITYQVSALDLDGNPRVYNSPDIGAYELQPAAARTASGQVTSTSSAAGPGAVLETYPNPFTHTVTFAYALPKSGPVRLELLDALGRRVAVLVDETQAAGPHEARFEAPGAGGELYLVRLTTAEGSFTQKLTRQR